MKRLLTAAVLVVLASCAGSPDDVFSAGEQSAGFLGRTAREAFPTHRYEVDAGSPTSAWCSEPDGSPDRSRLATRSRIEIELEPGDDPLAMARRVVDHWEDSGHAVRVEGLGTDSIAAVFYRDDGSSFGLTAVDHTDDVFDALELSAVTACSPRP